MRKSFHCRHDNCDSEARHQACLRFWCIGNGKPRIELRCVSSIRICDRHQKAASNYLLSPVNKDSIRTAVLRDGLPPPDFSSAEITFVPIVNGEPVEELRVA